MRTNLSFGVLALVGIVACSGEPSGVSDVDSGAGGAAGGAAAGTAGISTGDGGAGGGNGGTAGGPGTPDGGVDAGTPGGGGSGGGPGGAGGAPDLPALTIYIAGDSTVMTYVNSAIHQGGWGQFLQSYFDPRAQVVNRAIGGRTSRRFIEEGRLATILTDIRAGDYLLVQFGTNDSNPDAVYPDGEPYLLAAGTEFKTWMQQYIDGARSKNAIPILVTPPPRDSCRADGVSFNYSFTAYATAMKELGTAGNVPVVDLGAATVAYLNTKNDCGWAGMNFFLIRADGTIDATHFQEMGADIMAGLIAQGLVALNSPLAAYLR